VPLENQEQPLPLLLKCFVMGNTIRKNDNSSQQSLQSDERSTESAKLGTMMFN